MKRKFLSLILAAFVSTSFTFNPALVTKVQAQENIQFVEPTKIYSQNKGTTIANGVGAIEAPASDVAIFKDLENFTMNTTLTMTAGSSTVQGIFFIGDSKQNLNYITIYSIPGQNKIGIESKNGGINDSFVSPVNISDGQPHKFTFTVSKGNYYKFYIDGKKVKEGSAPTTFTKGVVANADHMMFGNGKRSNNGNGYPLNGSLKNIELYNSAISEAQILSYHEDTEEKGVFSYKNAYYKNTEDKKYESSSESILASLKELDNGSITVRYRADSPSNGVMSLFSLSDSTQAGKYLNFYVNPSTNSVGVEVAGATAGNGNFILNDSNLTGKGVSIKNTNWHTVTVTKTNNAENDRYTFYIDGKRIDQYSSKVGFTNNINTADTINIGHVKRLNNTNNMPFTGAIDSIKVLDRVLAESEIPQLHKVTSDVTVSELDLTNAYKTEEKPLFYSGYEKSNDYRIPSLLTTKEGTVIAAVDKRNQHASDWGDIDTMIRRKEAGAKDFDEGKVILDLVDNRSGEANSAFLIDPSMVQDEETGRIYMLVDMFPESTGLWASELIKAGTGYKKIDGKDYQLLYDASNKEYTIREGGKVYDAEGNLTEYTVITECEAPYKELGNIYKNGEYKGNMYMFSGDDKGALNVVRTTYLWLMHSDDDGKTWSLPKDITPQVKKDWMKFIGTGPGVGIQLENGKLVFPIYHTNSNIRVSQSSAVIVSEDNGETWEIGESPMKTLGRDPETMTSGGMLTESQVIQTNNGELKLFMRNTIANTVQIATSNDEGKTWYKVENDPNIPEIYCQLSVIDFEKDGKEYVMISNPSLDGRMDGKVHLGEIAQDGSIKWTNSQLLAKGHFQYSSLTKLPDGKFGVLYELDDVNGKISINYTEFDENWIKATNKTVDIPSPNVESTNTVVDGNKIRVDLELTQKVFVAGQPSLNLKIGNKDLSATYVKGSGTDKLVFEATLNGDEVGTVFATSINETNGIIENALGGKLPEINKKLHDLTKIGRESYVGVAFTSQHSDSTEENSDGAAINVIDGNPNTYWHSTWGNANITLPQSVTLELKEETQIYKLSYLPRQNNSSGRVKDYDVLVSTDGTNFTKVVSGVLPDSKAEQSIEFIPVNAKYVKFQATSAHAGGGHSVAVAELGLYEYADGVFGDVDKSSLTEKVNNLKELIKGTYSEASVTKVLEELSKSEEFLNADIVSQSIIDNALKNLSYAEEGLVNVSKILDSISEFEGKNPNNYTNSSWEAYSNAVNQARGVIKTATTKKQVTDAVIKVNYMKANLAEEIKVDKAELTSLYERSKELIETDYTQESWVIFKQSFDNVKVVIDNADATQEEVNTAVTKLQSAISALEEVTVEVDKSLLEIIVKYAEDAKAEGALEDVVPVVAKKFEEALTNAKAVLNDKNATEAQVNEAREKLVELIHMLEFKKADKEKLTKLIAIVTSLDEVKYTSSTWSKLQAELKNANKVVNDENALVGDVTKAYEDLSNALLNLEIAADKSKLEKLVSDLETRDLSEYTKSTVDKFNVELSSAKAILIDKEVTQEQVNEAYNKLIKAYLDLRLIPDKSKLGELINKAEAIDVSKYTVESIKGLNKELAKVKAIFDNEEATKEEVENAEKNLGIALANLEPVQDNTNSSNTGTGNGETTENGGSNNGSGDTRNDSTGTDITSDEKEIAKAETNNNNNTTTNTGKGNTKLPSTGGTSSAAVGTIALAMTSIGVVLRRKK